MIDVKAPSAGKDWRSIVAPYQRADTRRAIIQMADTLIPLAVLFYVMYQSLALPYWTTLLLVIPAAGLLVRTFIIMHDCAHGSFLPSRRANSIIGWITGVLTLTPFGQWRHDHSLHHASAGDLNRRGHGDVETLTVREYVALPPFKRFRYRFVRHPLVMFGLGPIHWIVTNRIPPRDKTATKREHISVWSANVAIALLFGAVWLWLGWRAIVLVYAPSMYLAAAAGIGLFYVQHQFEGTYWKDHGEWDYATAAIRGSSYLALPAVLNWFTGSIGLHHVHHLGPRVPNYALKRCHEENAVFREATVLTLGRSVHTLRLALWHEGRGQLVGFGDVDVLAATRAG